MKLSERRILTTHTGSLARPADLLELLIAKNQGKGYDSQELAKLTRQAVAQIVGRQATVGLSVINDGEQSKIGFAPYVRDRLNGFDGPPEPRPVTMEAREFPTYAGRRNLSATLPTCGGPVTWRDFSEVERDISNLMIATAEINADEVFMSAVSPGTIANFYPNRFYSSREEYLCAVADVMKREYDAIVQAGMLLQIDGPDLALKANWFPDLTLEEFRALVAENIEALNYALRDIPAERVRLHVCWGAAEGPHNHDVPLDAILDLLLTAKPQGLSVVGSNGRHEHEWRIWQTVALPEDKVLIPGVIDSTTNIIEHPQVVADRIIRIANVLGPERVIAGVDCGFATSSLVQQVDPEVAWAKLSALRQGAELASRHLWPAGA